MRHRVGFGRYADDGFEDAMEVIGAEVDLLGQRVERWGVLGSLDQAAGLGNFARVLLVERRRVRLAALAWTESGSLRILARGVERHVLALGETRRTGRSAIDAGRCDRVDEVAVEGFVARDDGGVAAVIAVAALTRWLFDGADHVSRPCSDIGHVTRR